MILYNIISRIYKNFCNFNQLKTKRGEKKMKVTKCFYLIASIIVIIWFFVNCAAPGFTVQVMKPAEINLSGIDKIAIGSIDGRGGTEVSEELTSALFSSRRFDVLDRQHLDEIFREHELSFTGAIDEETATEIGKLVGSAALVFGRVGLHKYEETYSHEDWRDDKGRSHRTYKRNGKANVSMSLQITDLRSGKILAIKKLSDTRTDKKSGFDEAAEKIDSNKLLTTARKNCINSFMKSIAPYYVSEKVSFEKVKDMFA